ncbi:uncharacterized protein TRAVEDRAFT_66578 [Trametes versicolor FP-101664 SS1]|uniref:uncharacterized protein n=1 Tax=Trametes versicolor (strain FP-101664) TaxID=717944 RepID=UPI0004622437|nr:uncharacterized protein TRAVEDRAFT_66578 [Trametes versicolor FP-101664 SS1]EIW55403.1 hypothetical protein TRAVEDRAFT_66578 [Trametes versicolor FP-101664 SS1]
MPFSRYLGNGQDSHDDQDAVDHNVTFSSHVQFQLPNLILNAPTVPPGGGAEALPAGFYPPASSSSLAWFSAQEGYPNPFSLQAAAAAANYHHPPPLSAASPHSATSPSYNLPYVHDVSAHHPFRPDLPISIPSALGLPVYSASGFDILSILARVVHRPYPKISLGPVDLSCSFVVTDTRRFDSPIVYASPTFFKLTGYDEHEVVGRNCRFLQSPGGHLQRGQERHHTSQDAVAHLRKNIIADKECQVSIINYRKDGSAFINMVSVIPIRGGVLNHPDEADDIIFHVGFQVDLSEQPKAILGKLKDGTYLVNYSDKATSASPTSARDWRASSMSMRGVSKDLRALLANHAFLNSFQLSTSTHASTAVALTTNPAEPIALDPYDGNKPVHMILLDRSPDFLHVVSLKGAFLYAAPAVRTVLGYDPDELVGRSLTDFCHPADCVPLMRELKEASATPGSGGVPTGASPSPSASAGMNTSADSPPHAPTGNSPRSVNLLFRMQTKTRGYVWIECRGRLHIEPGKGRKAIILSGRLRNLPYLEWGPVSRAGGLVAPLYKSLPAPIATTLDGQSGMGDRPPEREFWGMVSTAGTFLCVGAAVRDVLGWGAGEVIGKPIADIVSGKSAQDIRMAVDVEMAKVLADTGGNESAGLACEVHTKERGTVSAHVVLYRSRQQQPTAAEEPAAGTSGGDTMAYAPVVCQVKLCEGSAPPPTGAVVHAHEDSVFAETELDRGSSWQYELQQLKFRNQRLVEEVVALEAAITKKMRRRQSLGAIHAAGASSSAVVGLGISATARNAAAARMYPHPASGMQPQPPAQVSQPLNVRFVSGSQGVPIIRPPTRPHPQSHPQSHPHPGSSALPPTPQTQMMHPQTPSPSMTHTAPSAYVQQAYAPRVRHSLDSALQGWSEYAYESRPEGGGGGGGGQGMGGGGTGMTSSRATSFTTGNVPMKRTWDSSVRDHGGGASGGE